ncbi:hypothetical protein [Tardiphaga sp.]|jgi:hypothetical protein|uniref:hypothetical protein n=1 Tax=Tardiphaga sp. TaxID=1926292 RepID=UPI0037DA3208
MSGSAHDQFELLRFLCNLADQVVATRMVNLSRETIASLRERVAAARTVLLDDDAPRLIDYEAACAVECMAELAYARADQSKPREDRAVMYLNTLRNFMRGDLNIAERKSGRTVTVR